MLAVTLSMMLGPLLLLGYEAIVKNWLTAAKPDYDNIEERDIPVIIAGFGRFGQIVARILRVKGIPFTALDSNQTHVDFVRRFGNQVYYGDASRLDLLRAAGAQTAQFLVLAHAAKHPTIVNTNTVRVLEGARTLNLIDAADGELLRAAATLYHDLTQLLRLCLSGRALTVARALSPSEREDFAEALQRAIREANAERY